MGWLDAGEYGLCNPPVGGAEAAHPEMKVTWSKVRFRAIDSTD
jgi:hypothetical protein